MKRSALVASILLAVSSFATIVHAQVSQALVLERLARDFPGSGNQANEFVKCTASP